MSTLRRMPALQTKEEKLDLLLCISFAGFLFTLVFYYRAGFYHAVTWPWNTPLYFPPARFSDFTDMLRIGENLATASETSFYLPAANLYFYAFGLLPIRLARLLFLLFPALVLTCCAAGATKGIPTARRCAYVMGIFLTSFPFLIAIDRGNLELHLFSFLALFAYFYSRETRGTRIAAAFCLAIAIAFKGYPAVFALLYLKDRRLKELGLAAAFCLAVTAIAAHFQGGLYHCARNFINAAFTVSNLDVRVMSRYNLSIYSPIRLLLRQWNLGEAERLFMSVYSILAAATLLGISALALRRTVSFWRAFTALGCAVCFLPNLSFDYRLLLLVVPLCLFIRAKTEATWQHNAICVLFALLLLPKGHVILSYEANLGGWGPGIITTATYLDPLLLVCLTILVLFPRGIEVFPDAPLATAPLQASQSPARTLAMHSRLAPNSPLQTMPPLPDSENTRAYPDDR